MCLLLSSVVMYSVPTAMFWPDGSLGCIIGWTVIDQAITASVLPLCHLRWRRAAHLLFLFLVLMCFLLRNHLKGFLSDVCERRPRRSLSISCRDKLGYNSYSNDLITEIIRRNLQSGSDSAFAYKFRIKTVFNKPAQALSSPEVMRSCISYSQSYEGRL